MKRGLLVSGFLVLPLVVAAVVKPLAFGSAANTGFRDEMPNDKKGGWIDLGGNDLHDLKAGPLVAAGVSFEIADESKPCAIVLGGHERSYLPQKAELPVGEFKAEKFYLLHAAAFTHGGKDVCGTLVFSYADGTREEKQVQVGRDVADWTSPGKYSNAARAWTVYNGNTQVSLYVSMFALQAKPLRSVTFVAGTPTWMIVGASAGEGLKLLPMQPLLKPTKTFRSPPPFSDKLSAEKTAGMPKNVILIIGDGMGQGAVAYTSLRQYHARGRTLFERMPVATLCTTFSGNSDVTDSAASGTAFSCGQKTDNGMVATLPDGTELESSATAAKRAGKAVAIMTNDKIQGATPAVFYAHAKQRGRAQSISDYLVTCGFDVLIGRADSQSWLTPKSKGGQRTDERDTLAEMAGKGYAVVTSVTAVATAPEGKPVVGCIGAELQEEEAMGRLLTAALGRLEKNPKGFFVMIESTYPDYGGHGNNPDLTLLGVTQVEWLARAALLYARAHEDTLVIVTADHETGGIQTSYSTVTKQQMIFYGTTSHTGNSVPFFAFGPGSSLFDRLIDDTDIGLTLRSFMKR